MAQWYIYQLKSHPRVSGKGSDFHAIYGEADDTLRMATEWKNAISKAARLPFPMDEPVRVGEYATRTEFERMTEVIASAYGMSVFVHNSEAELSRH